MQRVFTEDIYGKDGRLRWARGGIFDYPSSTWGSISRTLARQLDEFSIDTASAAEMFTKPRRGRPRKEMSDGE